MSLTCPNCEKSFARFLKKRYKTLNTFNKFKDFNNFLYEIYQDSIILVCPKCQADLKLNEKFELKLDIN